MSPRSTARERVRDELIAEITATARAHLVEHGAGGLSLRAVARELGMASSAIYRYFPSRDDLLTTLITESFAALGAAAVTADDAHADAPPRQRWLAVCAAIRAWARAHRHEFTLLYGSPVPGYVAPRSTVEPATRAMLVLLRSVRAAVVAGDVDPGEPVSPTLHEQLADVARRYAPEVPEPVLARFLLAMTQLYGMIGFELSGHLVGSVDPADEFATYCAERLADVVGLRPL